MKIKEKLRLHNTIHAGAFDYAETFRPSCRNSCGVGKRAKEESTARRRVKRACEE